MLTQDIQYQDHEVLLEGFLACPDNSIQRPAVLICHDWAGCNDFVRRKAEKIAEMGYVGFAIDMYGKDKRGQTKEEKSALMSPFMSDRNLLLQRIRAGLKALKGLSGVDTTKIAAMGFCFGGLCALDLARSGEAIRGVVSFHGLLNAPEEYKSSSIKAKVLALHGYDDPMGPPNQVIEFANEMTAVKADWQLQLYGHTLHAFTNPEANDQAFGTVYNAQADQRSWQAMINFLQEIFV
jgi:dienelactone hydrolase